jgi:alpha-ketoglutarate-dependent taurine dioxygenase
VREALSAEAESLKFTADMEKITIDQINQEEEEKGVSAFR